MLCRTLADTEAAAAADAIGEEIRPQQWADTCAAILAPHLPAVTQTQAA